MRMEKVLTITAGIMLISLWTDEPTHTDASGTVMPERMNEQWCAPDLQAVILQVSQEHPAS
jgi:hypothetical protein